MTNSIYTMTVTPNLQDFQIAVYHVLGTGLPKHIEDVITEITENFDIRYDNPLMKTPWNVLRFLRTSSCACCKLWKIRRIFSLRKMVHMYI